MNSITNQFKQILLLFTARLPSLFNAKQADGWFQFDENLKKQKL